MMNWFDKLEIGLLALFIIWLISMVTIAAFVGF